MQGSVRLLKADAGYRKVGLTLLVHSLFDVFVAHSCAYDRPIMITWFESCNEASCGLSEGQIFIFISKKFLLSFCILELIPYVIFFFT